MTSDLPVQFPQYPAKPQPVQFAHPVQAKPLLKLMTRAFRGKGHKSLFDRRARRRKPRIL